MLSKRSSIQFSDDFSSRGKSTAEKLLLGYQGSVRSDGNNDYDNFENNFGFILNGYWAHFQKFIDALDEDKMKASQAFIYINKLYYIEKMAHQNNLDCQLRKGIRKE